ncbi:HCO3 transporter family-domain-containing protein [Aspergillus spinulosporus]
MFDSSPVERGSSLVESPQVSREEFTISYAYPTSGWRRYRALRPGRGMYHDVRRRLPYYWSDITDSFTYRTVASTVRILHIRHDQTYRKIYGLNESLLSSALAAMVHSVLAAQPLTIVGVTGLISLFNYTIYNIIARYDPAIYTNFMCWTAIWAAIFHWIVALCNLRDYMRYVTDFRARVLQFKSVEQLTDGLAPAQLQTLVSRITRRLSLCGTFFWTGFAHFPGPSEKPESPQCPLQRHST